MTISRNLLTNATGPFRSFSSEVHPGRSAAGARVAFSEWLEGGLPQGEFPSAADVVYRNPVAIASRLRLFHLLRLKMQEKIDRKELARIYQKGTPSLTDTRSARQVDACNADDYRKPSASLKIARVTFEWTPGRPGVGQRHNPVRSGAVRVHFPVSGLGLSPGREMECLKRLTGLAGSPIIQSTGISGGPLRGILSIRSSSFPFLRQNLLEVRDVFRDLISETRKIAATDMDLAEDPESIKTANKLEMGLPQALSRQRIAPYRWLARPERMVPDSWLRSVRSPQLDNDDPK